MFHIKVDLLWSVRSGKRRGFLRTASHLVGDLGTLACFDRLSEEDKDRSQDQKQRNDDTLYRGHGDRVVRLSMATSSEGGSVVNVARCVPGRGAPKSWHSVAPLCYIAPLSNVLLHLILCLLYRCCKLYILPLVIVSSVSAPCSVDRSLLPWLAIGPRTCGSKVSNRSVTSWRTNIRSFQLGFVLMHALVHAPLEIIKQCLQCLDARLAGILADRVPASHIVLGVDFLDTSLIRRGCHYHGRVQVAPLGWSIATGDDAELECFVGMLQSILFTQSALACVAIQLTLTQVRMLSSRCQSHRFQLEYSVKIYP